MRKLHFYVNDIIAAMNAIENFVDEAGYDDFINDDRTVSAVIRKLEIIGEAVKHIPDEIRKEYEDIPWKEMAGLRDKLIHFYFGIQPTLIWYTVKDVIPKIKPVLETLQTEIAKKTDKW
ncbi:MAG: DUF86 domain-containing protein [Nitrospirae bacterium YQR-1]